MMTSISNPHIHSDAPRAVRFSQIKRKPPPKETSSVRYPAADLQDPLAAIWGKRNDFADEQVMSSDDYVVPRPLTPSDDTHDLWNSLKSSSDSDAEGTPLPPKVLRQRPRAHTLPSERFSRLVRVPPPTVDVDLLKTTRSSGALRPSSLPEQIIIYPDLVPDIVTGNADNDAPHRSAVTVAQNDIPPAPSSHSSLKTKISFRKSIGFIEKRKSAVKTVTVASISAPVAAATPPRKYSVVSMASTANASMVSLSAFPQPPENLPPVPPLPSLYSQKQDLPPPSPRSFTLQVDPPAPTSQPSDVVAAEHVENSGDVQAASTTESPPSNDATVEEAQISRELRADSSASRPDLAQARNSYTLQVDPPPFSGLPPRPVTRGTSPIPVSTSEVLKGGNRAVHFDFGEPPDFDGFDETQLPTQRQLEEAAALPVISETGVRVPFGSLWQDQKTIVCFIRHFWCPLCQDYMFSISQNVSPEVLRGAGIELVIISNGSYEMIKSYRRIFHTPFALYTDPTHQVYNALGMTLQTLKKGPKGSYVRHGLIGGIGMVVVNAVKVGMPVWKEGGEISQLGGEFILGPGMTCSWVHRMRYTRSHVPILQVVEAAGVDMYTPLHRAASSTGGSFLGMSSEEESKWMERRRKVLKKLRGKKMSRRGGEQWIDTASTTTATSSNRSSRTMSSKRSSVGNEAAGSLCSWDPSTEQAINVGLSGYETAIIEEAEEEEEVLESGRERHPVDELPPVGGPHLPGDPQLADKPDPTAADEPPPADKPEPVQPADEPHPVDEHEPIGEPRPVADISKIESETLLEISNDTKSELSRDTDSFVSQDDDHSELGISSATDVDTVDGHSLDVPFDQVDIHFDSAKLFDEDGFKSNSARGSYSTVGSGFEVVLEHHGTLFGLGGHRLADKRPRATSITTSLSDSSLSSF